MGIGGIVGVVAGLALRRSTAIAFALALAGWGLPILVIGAVPVSVVAVLAFVVTGLSNALLDIVGFTLLQRGCRNEERGAVFAIFEATAGLFATIGCVAAPLLITAFGVRAALLATGALLPAAAAILWLILRRSGDVEEVSEEAIEGLRRIPAFRVLPLTAIERLVASGVPVSFGAGDILMRKGAPGDRFLVIETGTVEVTDGGRVLNVLGPGVGLGEIALLRGGPRTATVTALTDVTARSFDAGTFLAAVSGPAASAAATIVVDERSPALPLRAERRNTLARSPAAVPQAACPSRFRCPTAHSPTTGRRDPGKRHSAALTDGPDRAAARAMLKAIGFTDEDLAKPLVGVATTWIETMPCNFNQRRLAEFVKEGIRAAGGTPMEFNTISVSDGVSMGTEGMKASLVSREVIADSIELVVRGHLLDGLVCLVGCDKTIPGAAMALGRLDVPGLVLYNGTIYPGTYKGTRPRRSCPSSRRSARTGPARSRLEELYEIESAACPGAGACGGQFTANTMSTVDGVPRASRRPASTASRPRTRTRTRRPARPASWSMDARPPRHPPVARS